MACEVAAVVFDVGGVIAFQDTAAADEQLRACGCRLTADAVQAARDSEAMYWLWEDYSRGRMAPQKYWAAVLATLGLAPTPGLTELLQSVHQATVWSVIDRAVLDLVRRLRARDGLRLGILSNSAREYEPHVGSFVDLFDVAHFSHRTGRRKPDAAAFQELTRDLDVPLAATVFVDDKFRNVAAAAALGMRGVCYTGVEPLAELLLGLGLLT